MTIDKLEVFGNGACSECQRGKLSKSGLGLEYPYKYTYHITIGQQQFRLCEECKDKLIKELQKLK